MRLTEIQDLAIQARMALIYAKDEQTAAEIEDDFSPHIATVAAAILNQAVEVVVVMPKVLN